MRSLLTLFICFSLLLACGDDTTADPLVGTTWLYATQNPVTASQTERARRQEVLAPGTLLTVTDSTLVLNRLYHAQELIVPRYDSLAGGDTAQLAVKLTTPSPEILNVDLFRSGTLETNRYFTPMDTSLREIAPKALVGRTYRYQPAGAGSEMIYFGYSERGGVNNMPKAYFVEYPTDWRVEQSKVVSEKLIGNLFGPFSAVGFDGPYVRMAHKFLSGNFGKGTKRLYRDGEGNTLVQVFDIANGQHRLQYVFLDPVAGTVPEDVDQATLGRQLTEAEYVINLSYPDADSALVSYTDLKTTNRKIIPYAALRDLEFSFNEDGSFFLLAGDRVLRAGNWQLSDDRNWLLIGDEDSVYPTHYPILKYNEDGLAFRGLFEATTRKPRGVKLDSYTFVNLYIEAKFR